MASPFDTAWVLMKGIIINGQEVQPDEYGNYSAPGISMSGVNTGGGDNADVMAMFEQVQAAKRARQQQMIDAGLNPITGMVQGKAPNAPPPPQTQSTPAALPEGFRPWNSSMPIPPPPQPCPTCGGAGHV